MLGSGKSHWSWWPLHIGNSELRMSLGNGIRVGCLDPYYSLPSVMEFLSYKWELVKRNKSQKVWLYSPGILPFSSVLEVMRILAACFLMEGLSPLIESQSQRAPSLLSCSYPECYLHKGGQEDGRKAVSYSSYARCRPSLLDHWLLTDVLEEMLFHSLYILRVISSSLQFLKATFTSSE